MEILKQKIEGHLLLMGEMGLEKKKRVL